MTRQAKQMKNQRKNQAVREKIFILAHFIYVYNNIMMHHVVQVEGRVRPHAGYNYDDCILNL